MPRERFEHQRRLREAAEQRGGREEDQPDREDHPAPEHVGERAGGQQQRGQRQRVGVDHPLQVGEARVQARLDPRQRDVHDRDVEQQHEGRDADRDQRPPLAVHVGPRIARECCAPNAYPAAARHTRRDRPVRAQSNDPRESPSRLARSQWRIDDRHAKRVWSRRNACRTARRDRAPRTHGLRADRPRRRRPEVGLELARRGGPRLRQPARRHAADDRPTPRSGSSCRFACSSGATPTAPRSATATPAGSPRSTT